MTHGPEFDNTLGQITFTGRTAHFIVEQARSAPDGTPRLDTVIDTDPTRNGD
jgi:hypothetical protein